MFRHVHHPDGRVGMDEHNYWRKLMKVYTYDFDGSRHCREGWAVGERDVLRDTFWGSGHEAHVLTQPEAQSARLQFDTDDFDLITVHHRGEPNEWLERKPEDRASLPHQHGLQVDYYIRKGSRPDYDTKVAEAQSVLDEAQRTVKSAVLRVEWAQRDLHELKGALNV